MWQIWVISHTWYLGSIKRREDAYNKVLSWARQERLYVFARQRERGEERNRKKEKERERKIERLPVIWEATALTVMLHNDLIALST